MTPRSPTPESALFKLAGDLMSSPAVAAAASDPVSSVARLMLEAGINGLPVVDAAGVPIGMVSDGDLMGRRGDHRRAWWLEMLAQSPSPDAGSLRDSLDRPVHEVMSLPLITIARNAPVQVIAEALQAHRVKRLPVMNEGRLVGVVTRADLLRVVESAPSARLGRLARENDGRGLLSFLESLIGGASLRGELERREAARTEEKRARSVLSAAAFRAAVHAHKAGAIVQEQAHSREEQLERGRQIKALLDYHVGEALWRELLHHAELAAASGEQELMLLRFPSDLCTDGGRKIDVSEQGWEETLRGEAAELYSRWRTELKPQGFGLSARIVSYEDDGIIGDLGLYLTWGG
jgi:CBS domain-containing protein